MTDTTFMRTWAEIDLDALDHNYKTLRGETEAGCRFLGLCKANAYGHGDYEISTHLEKKRCKGICGRDDRGGDPPAALWDPGDDPHFGIYRYPPGEKAETICTSKAAMGC